MNQFVSRFLKYSCLITVPLVIHSAYANTNDNEKSCYSKILDKYCEFNDKIPAWVGRTDFYYGIAQTEKPSWNVETIQPLYQTKNTLMNTVFIQARYAYQENDSTLNVGIGYRYLTPNNCHLFGINAFYDKTFKYNHQRTGVGAEYFNPYTFFRFNYYHAESGLRNVSTIGGVTTTQQALSGWDVQGEGPFPYLPWTRFVVDYFHWNTIQLVRLQGYFVQLNMNITENFQMEVGRISDQFTTPRMYARFNWLFGRNPVHEYTLCNSGWCGATPFARYHLKLHTLEKVRRFNDIVYEQSTSGGSGVAIARGT